mgnify:CR=1 FL=1
MPLNNPRPGPGNVSDYMVSGIPWVTSSALTAGETRKISIPSVSRFFTVKNETSSTTMAVGFTQNGLKPLVANYFTLDGGESYDAEIRVIDLWLSASVGVPAFEVIVGMTSIHRSDFPTLTGSSGHLGIG